MALHDFTVHDLIRRNSVAFARLPAWAEPDDGRQLTFADMGAAVESLAAGLQKMGLRKGDRIGVLGKNSLEYFLLFGAAGAIGAVVVPINWRLSDEEVIFILNDGTPKLLFADSEYHERINSFRHQLNSVQSFFNLAREGSTEFPGFETLLYKEGLSVSVDVTEKDDLAILYTAAVGGQPRGAVLTHRNFVSASVHLNLLMHLGSEDVHLNLMPLFHVGGIFMALMSFHAGARNVNMPKFDAGRAAELIELYKVTALLDFAPTLESIMEAGEGDGRSILTLRHVMGLDTPETINRYQKLTGGTFYSIYGQTETSAIVTLGRYDDRPGSVGRTIALADVRLVDEYDRPVSAGEVGEITVKGPMVFERYWNLPEETSYVFRNGWHHTGDLAYFDVDGFMFYSGRKPEKELIKTGGENVYPAEVEQVILKHPEVEKAVVFGVPDAKWKESVHAVCALSVGSQLTETELIEFVGKNIARHKKPRQVQFVKEIPTLEDGRADRETVKKRFAGNTDET